MTPAEIIRRRPASFTIEGKVSKMGETWLHIEGTDEVKTHEVEETNEKGQNVKKVIHYHPFSLLAVYSRLYNYHEHVIPGAVMTFRVEVSIAWDERFKKPVNRFWLVGMRESGKPWIDARVEAKVPTDPTPSSDKKEPASGKSGEEVSISTPSPSEAVNVEGYKPRRSSRYANK